VPVLLHWLNALWGFFDLASAYSIPMGKSREDETYRSYLGSAMAFAGSRGLLRIWAAIGGYHVLTFAWSWIYDPKRWTREGIIPWVPFISSIDEIIGVAGSILAYAACIHRMFGYTRPTDAAGAARATVNGGIDRWWERKAR
jgi:hypothetical protein